MTNLQKEHLLTADLQNHLNNIYSCVTNLENQVKELKNKIDNLTVEIRKGGDLKQPGHDESSSSHRNSRTRENRNLNKDNSKNCTVKRRNFKKLEKLRRSVRIKKSKKVVLDSTYRYNREVIRL